jgi:hypothetical protein
MIEFTSSPVPSPSELSRPVPLMLARPVPLAEGELLDVDVAGGVVAVLDEVPEMLVMQGLAKGMVATSRFHRDPPSCRQSTRQMRKLYPPLERVFWRQTAPPERTSKKLAMAIPPWPVEAITAAA